MTDKSIVSVAPRDEQETVINYQGWDGAWHFSSNNPVHIRKWQKFVTPSVRQFDSLGRVVNLVGTITGANVQISKQRQLTPEQTELQTRRLAKAREAKRNG